MYIPVLVEMFLRELDKLHEEINLYENEQDLWKISVAISNSSGNLCLHLCGNLQHFIGAILGKTGYERKREQEFTLKHVSQSDLLVEIEKARAVVEVTLKNLHEEDLDQIYPVHKSGKEMTTIYLLTHILCHLNYHLGQINYHRRMI